MTGTPNDDASLSISLFGPTLTIFAPGAAANALPEAIPLAVRTRKGRWLLALLALNAGRAMSRDRIAGNLWPESETSRETLRRTLTDLRTALGDHASLIESTNLTICLRVPPASVDVLKFDMLLRARDLPSIEAAIALYKGPLLEECDEPWILADREQRRAAYAVALEHAARGYRAAGRLTDSVASLRLAVAAAPLRESLYRGLMETLAQNGEETEAILVYRRLRLLLRQELQTEPSAEATALFDRIRASNRTARMPRALASATRPWNAPHGDGDAGTARSAARQATFPQPLTALLGRDVEYGELSDGLTRLRLITLTGAGGIGKTRLAVEVAARELDKFPDGVWFVELAAIADPALVTALVARVLEVHEERGQDLEQRIVTKLGTGRHLLILDNCEHVIDGCAALAREIANRCPNVHVLATSRRPLRLTGEVVQRLNPLALPDLDASPGEITERRSETFRLSPAVQLFVERAAAVQPAFTASPRNLVAVADICCRLDGIPLALELAAARAASLSVEQISNLLGSRFRLLTVGDRAARPRQQSLRALVDWSYDLLDPEHRPLLARLSVFAGGWTLDAAASVCIAPDEEVSAAARWDMLEALEALVESSLVLAEPGTDGGARYRMLETIREYAGERLRELGGEAETRHRHAQWFLSYAERPEEPGDGQARKLAALAREHDNLRLALQHAASSDDRLRLALAMSFFWDVHAHYKEGRSWLERALAETPDAPSTLRSRALRSVGNLCWAQGDLTSARQMHLQNLEIHQSEGDRSGLSHTLNSLGLVALHQGDFRTASDYYRQSIGLLRENGERHLTAPILGNLAIALKNLGDFDDALAQLAEAEAIARESGDLRALAQALQVHGTISIQRGDYAQARAFAEEALDANRTLGNTQGIAIGEHGLGELAFAQGDHAAAAAHFTQALESFREIGSIRSAAASLASLGDVAVATGNDELGRDYHRQSLTIELELDNRSGMADSLLTIALIEARTGDPQTALRLIATVETDAERSGTPLPEKRREEIAAARALMGETASGDFATPMELRDTVSGWLRGTKP